MGILESDLQSQLRHLSCQLEQLKLTHRDASLKFQREQHILKRLVISVITVLETTSHEFPPQASFYLTKIQQGLENQTDISLLLPHLTVLESQLKHHKQGIERQRRLFNEKLQHSANSLLKKTGSAPELSHNIRAILSASSDKAYPIQEHALKLIALYDQALKIHTETVDSGSGSENHSLFTAHNDLNDLIDALQHTITELDFDGEFGPQLLDIRSQLLLGVNSETLLELTLKTLKLVVEATRNERHLSQQFLQKLTLSISSSLNTAIHNEALYLNTFEHRQGINNEMRHLINQSQQALEHSQNLDELQVQMTPLLTNLASLSQRLERLESRERKLQERLQYHKHQTEIVLETTQNFHRALEAQTQRTLYDPLTKMLNRSAFIQRLESEYQRRVRSQCHLHLTLFDIDKFAAINKHYGLKAGDKALKIIARTMHKHVKEKNVLARFNGEEFMLLMIDETEDRNLSIVTNIQQEIRQLPFRFREQDIMITLTAVTTTFNNSDTPEKVLERLTSQLEESKQITRLTHE